MATAPRTAVSFLSFSHLVLNLIMQSRALLSLLLLVAAAGICAGQGPLPPYLRPSTFLPGQHPKKCKPGTTWVG